MGCMGRIAKISKQVAPPLWVEDALAFKQTTTPLANDFAPTTTSAQRDAKERILNIPSAIGERRTCHGDIHKVTLATSVS